MSVRLRFVLTLTLVVSLILLSSFFIIYTLYAHSREQDFNKRLWAHAYSEYMHYFSIEESDSLIEAKLKNFLPGEPINYQFFIVSPSFQLIRPKPTETRVKIDTSLLIKIKEKKMYSFTRGVNEGVGLYLNKQGQEYFVIATAYDKYGLSRLNTLKFIMIFVALGSILTIGLFAFFYVIIISRPLVNLSAQMRRITETNLKQRVNVGKGNIKNNEIVQIASNFNDMLDRLERAFQIQKNFVHHASHELRTPLATMMAQTESALRRDQTAEEYKKVLESLKEDQQEMIDLANSLLLLSQYETVRYSPDWPLVRIDELVYDSIAAVQKTLPDLNANFDFINAPDNEDYLAINGNETLLKSAFRNLIKNAYKYSASKEVRIALETHAHRIHIHFDNDGPVMKPKETPHLFLPFFRGENSQKQKGFGLGLPIVKRIIELHRGIIEYHALDENTNRFSIMFIRP